MVLLIRTELGRQARERVWTATTEQWVFEEGDKKEGSRKMKLTNLNLFYNFAWNLQLWDLDQEPYSEENSIRSLHVQVVNMEASAVHDSTLEARNCFESFVNTQLTNSNL